MRNILMALVALLIVLVVVVALQPTDYRVERTAKIEAPVADVFPHVNDFQNWEAWSPWAKLDPDAKIDFEGEQASEGAVMTWAGDENVGVGKMTLVESKPDEAVRIKVEFTEPFEGGTNSEFSFAPKGDETDVAWAMHGQHNFFEKAFCLVVNGLGMMGDDIEKGLGQLKSVVEQG